MVNLKHLENLEGMNFSDELKYAVECGVKFEVKVLEGGDIQVSWNSGKCVEILSFEFDTEVEEVEEVETLSSQEDCSFEEMKETINNMDKIQKLVVDCVLTDKELNVLEAIVYHSYEDGLPVFTNEIAKRANLTQKQTVGVISSLYKKEFLESYLDDGSPSCQDMYHLTSEWFEKFKGYC